MASQGRRKSDSGASERTPPSEMNYEQAVGALEAIIDRIESGEIGLEDAVKAYERGSALKKRCEEILSQAEQRIEELSQADLDAEGGEGGRSGEDET